MSTKSANGLDAMVKQQVIPCMVFSMLCYTQSTAYAIALCDMQHDPLTSASMQRYLYACCIQWHSLSHVLETTLHAVVH